MGTRTQGLHDHNLQQNKPQSHKWIRDVQKIQNNQKNVNSSANFLFGFHFNNDKIIH